MSEAVHRFRDRDVFIHGARCARGAAESDWHPIQIDGGWVLRIGCSVPTTTTSHGDRTDIDLTGYLIFPGLVNAHDHLQFALYPRLGDPPYGNYVEWGEAIHRRYANVIALHHRVPKDVRLWWGGIRNLLCGVTTVCHHDPLWPELQREDFPVRVVQQYGWSHSLALGGDLLKAYRSTPEDAAFILHACEGVDARAEQEFYALDQLGLLNANTVLVHGLALNKAEVDLLQDRQSSLILCPSSNEFLFNKVPSMNMLEEIKNLSLGNDSPLTAEGDLLDEIRFAIRHCGISSDHAYAMVTEVPAKTLRLSNQEGKIREGGVGDLIAVRDTGRSPGDTLQSLSMHDVEFVMIGGCVHLASKAISERLPTAAKNSLEPLWIDGAVRWLRAPVGELLRQAEAVLGKDSVRLGGRLIRRRDDRLSEA